MLNLRGINWKFTIVFALEFITLFSILYWIRSSGLELAKIVELVSSVLFSFGALLLTTAISYHHFWLHPDLKFKGVIIEPLDINYNNVAEQRFRTPVYERTANGTHSSVRDNIEPDTEDGFKVIECSSPCWQLRIAGDVSNIGGSKTKIHEYSYYMTKPVKTEKLGTYINRRFLENEERGTVDFLFPAIRGKVELKIEVVATKKKSQKVIIEVSDDLKRIRWKEYDC